MSRIARLRTRLHVRTAGARQTEGRVAVPHIFARQSRAEPVVRSNPGDLTLQKRAVKFRSARNMPYTEPNSPLLKRIVRRPMVMEIGYVRRRRNATFEPGLAKRERLRFEPPLRDLPQVRAARQHGNPLRAVPIHPAPRPRLSADAWLASREGA